MIDIYRETLLKEDTHQEVGIRVPRIVTESTSEPVGCLKVHIFQIIIENGRAVLAQLSHLIFLVELFHFLASPVPKHQLLTVLGTLEKQRGQVYHGGHVLLVGSLKVQIGCFIHIFLIDFAVGIRLVISGLLKVVPLIKLPLPNLVAYRQIIKCLYRLATLNRLLEVLDSIHEVLIVVEVEGTKIVLGDVAVLLGSFLIELPRLFNSDVR